VSDLEPRNGSDPSPAAAAAAHDVDQRIRGNVRRMRGMWVELAEDLTRFHRAEQWRDLGHTSFEAYLADPGLELNRRWVYNLIAAYQQLVIDRGVDAERLKHIHVSKATEILPALRRDQVTVEEALSDAETLTKDDLVTRYRGTASSTPGRVEPSQLEPEREPSPRHTARCPTCGQTIR
jgi:hypothetical protein